MILFPERYPKLEELLTDLDVRIVKRGSMVAKGGEEINGKGDLVYSRSCLRFTKL